MSERGELAEGDVVELADDVLKVVDVVEDVVNIVEDVVVEEDVEV